MVFFENSFIICTLFNLYIIEKKKFVHKTKQTLEY